MLRNGAVSRNERNPTLKLTSGRTSLFITSAKSPLQLQNESLYCASGGKRVQGCVLFDENRVAWIFPNKCDNSEPRICRTCVTLPLIYFWTFWHTTWRIRTNRRFFALQFVLHHHFIQSETYGHEPALRWLLSYLIITSQLIRQMANYQGKMEERIAKSTWQVQESSTFVVALTREIAWICGRTQEPKNKGFRQIPDQLSSFHSCVTNCSKTSQISSFGWPYIHVIPN